MDLEQTLKYSNFFDNCIYQISRPMILSYLSEIDFNIIYSNTLKTLQPEIPNISTEFKRTMINVLVESIGFDNFKIMVEKNLLSLCDDKVKHDYDEVKKSYLEYCVYKKPIKFNYDVELKIDLRYKDKIAMLKTFIESEKLSIDTEYLIDSEPYSLIERCLRTGTIIPEQLPYIKHLSKIISVLDGSENIQMKHVAESLQYFIPPRIIYQGF